MFDELCEYIEKRWEGIETLINHNYNMGKDEKEFLVHQKIMLWELLDYIDKLKEDNNNE